MIYNCWHEKIEKKDYGYVCADCEVHVGDTEEEALEGQIGAAAGICGCGRPELSHEFLRKFLWCLSSENKDKGWTDDVEKLVRDDPEGAAQVIMQWASEIGLTEHGSSVPGWTDFRRGEFLLAKLGGKPEEEESNEPDKNSPQR